VSVVEEIQKAAKKRAKRIELVEYGEVTFCIVNGKVKRIKYEDGELIPEEDEKGN
jgi:hypothetical protein